MTPPSSSPLLPHEPEYSLPFDTIATNILSCRQTHGTEFGADPLYDSIDEMQIRNIYPSEAVEPMNRKVEHIYDEPEGCAATAPKPPASVYDDPEEMRGEAWRIMGTAADPKGHEYPYNPRVDDYAVPKRPQRLLPVTQSTSEEEGDGEEEPPQEAEQQQREDGHDSPYNNVMVKMM